VSEHVLVSPLGFSPGAVSGVYFALQEQGIQIERVITVGTGHDGVRHAAGTLDMLFRRVEGVTYKACFIDAQELRGRIPDASGPFAARVGLYVHRARQAGQTVHVAVTGGRSGMGALAALAAQLYRAHHLYHLWVDAEIERGGADPRRVRPDPSNEFVNPTAKGPEAWNLVELPFVDLSGLLQDAAKYRSSGQVPESWTAQRLVGEGPAMLKALSHYVPAGLTFARARELLELVAEWRQEVEWIANDGSTLRTFPDKVDRTARQEKWERALSFLYTAGALDDEGRQDMCHKTEERIAERYVRQELGRIFSRGDLGLFAWWDANQGAVLASVRQADETWAQKAIDRESLTTLRQLLAVRFSEGELRTLCFDLGVGYEDLVGEGKADKARELVAYLERRKRIPDLIRIGERSRPDIPWRDEIDQVPVTFYTLPDDQLSHADITVPTLVFQIVESWLNNQGIR
jgi:hypothetical protein